MTTPPPILILGGTSEAAELASELTASGRDVVLSFAGMTDPRDLPPVRRRIGGFGGVAGLVRELRHGGYGLLVDATHPFATRMERNAAEAARVSGVPHLRLLRPPWQARPGDTWYPVDDLAAAARQLGELGARRAFLTIGRTELESFADVPGVHLVLRSIQPPTALPTGDVTVLLGRGPFTVDAELALLQEHRVEVLVTRNSGGAATAAKLAAARRLGIPVIIVQRHSPPPAELASTVAEALAWVQTRLGE